MRPRLGVLCLIGVLLLAGCGSSSALDDAVVPASASSASPSAAAESSAPASTAPASTAPASTAPASTAPASTAPASPTASATASEAREAPLVSRTLEILIGTGARTGSFAWDSGYSACPGVAWGGVTGGSPAMTVSIDVSAGDGACSQAAQWLAQRADTVIGTNGTINTSGPSELTYAFSGSLTIDGNPFSVVIGQSSDGTWWIGGEDWDSRTDGGEVCTSQVWNGTELVMYAIVGEGGSQFTVTDGSIIAC